MLVCGEGSRPWGSICNRAERTKKQRDPRVRSVLPGHAAGHAQRGQVGARGLQGGARAGRSARVCARVRPLHPERRRERGSRRRVGGRNGSPRLGRVLGPGRPRRRPRRRRARRGRRAGDRAPRGARRRARAEAGVKAGLQGGLAAGVEAFPVASLSSCFVSPRRSRPLLPPFLSPPALHPHPHCRSGCGAPPTRGAARPRLGGRPAPCRRRRGRRPRPTTTPGRGRASRRGVRRGRPLPRRGCVQAPAAPPSLPSMAARPPPAARRRCPPTARDRPPRRSVAAAAAAERAKLAVFVSGGGSNLQAIHAATLDGRIEADVAVREWEREGGGREGFRFGFSCPPPPPLVCAGCCLR